MFRCFTYFRFVHFEKVYATSNGISILSAPPIIHILSLDLLRNSCLLSVVTCCQASWLHVDLVAIKLLNQTGQHLCELADDARLSTADETNIVANQLHYSRHSAKNLQWGRSAGAVCVLGGRECPRQKQEEGSAGSVKVVSPLQEQLSFFSIKIET